MRKDLLPLVFGVFVSTLLSGTLVIAGLKAGITPGVSPLVVLFAWGAFRSKVGGGQGSRFLNISQVAGSAGMAVTSGVIFTAPLVQILYKNRGLEVPPVDYVTLTLLSLAGALMGFGFVGLATKKFLTDPTLPAPEARACEAMIDAAVHDKGERPKLGRSLVLGSLLGAFAPLIVALGLATDHVVLFAKKMAGRADFRADLPLSPIYIGIGGLLSISTALLVFTGSSMRLIGDFILVGIDPASEQATLFPDISMRWVGGAAMTVAVAYSLVKFLGVRTSSAASVSAEDERILAVDPKQKVLLYASILGGLVLMVGWLFTQEGGVTTFGLSMSAAVSITLLLMVTLGAILSLQIGSSASPVSGTVFVTTLILCLVALQIERNSIDDVLLLTPLLVGACVAVCTANDSSQDYKTMQFCGVPVQDGFLAQILGLIGGCLIVPYVLYIAHEAFTLGSPELEAPQGALFATLVDAILLAGDLAWGPIAVGLALGAFAVGLDIVGGKRGIQLPSMALAVGIYLPPYIGVGILIGATCRWLGERGGKQRGESILAAAGLITGAAAFDLVIGSLIVATAPTGGMEFSPASLLLFGETPALVMNILGLVGIGIIGVTLFTNSRNKTTG